tara:strand:- start:78 stop:326 length:249 start_codon:yes stop_codon:yes gene_type:complete
MVILWLIGNIILIYFLFRKVLPLSINEARWVLDNNDTDKTFKKRAHFIMEIIFAITLRATIRIAILAAINIALFFYIFVRNA